MKSISTELAAHLQQQTTTLTTLVKLTTKDNTIYTFTEFNSDIEYNNLVYKAANSFIPTEISAAASLAPENIELTAIISDLTGFISETELLTGKLYNAKIEIFKINYLDHSMGELNLASGYIGEAKLLDDRYVVELRGITSKYNNKLASLFSKTCRAQFGDSKCGIKLDPTTWASSFGFPLNYSIVPTVPNGRRYRALQGGVSGAVEPVWSTAIGNTIEDGSVIWLVEEEYKKYNNTANSPKFIKFQVFDSNSAPRLLEFQVIDDTDTVIFPDISDGSLDYAKVFDGNTTTGMFIYDTSWVLFQKNSNYTISKFKLITEIFSGDTISEFEIQVSYDNKISWDTIYRRSNLTSDFWFSLGGSNPRTLEIPITETSLGSRYGFNPPVSLFYDMSYLNNGLITWLTGDNAGTSIEIKYYDFDSNFIHFMVPTPFIVKPGDTFDAEIGCNHLLIGPDGTTNTGDCITKFGNILNFRGEPYIPSEDVLVGGIGETNKEPIYNA